MYVLLYSHIYVRKTKCMIMMPMKPSTYIVKFISPGSEWGPSSGQYGYKTYWSLELGFRLQIEA